MRRFTADYLTETRRGLWDDRSALADLDLPGRRRILDVGCGSGELTRVLATESGATVIGLDADTGLLAGVDAAGRIAGDATRLPLADDSVDLVVCQALLVNLPDPVEAVREFARVSSDVVAVIEPDNAAVTVESTVEREVRLSGRARRAYIRGVPTDVTLGDGAAALFRDVGLRDVSTRRHDHERQVTPPYSEADLEGARRKVTGARIEDARPVLEAALSGDGYEELRSRWRSMGRSVVEQMRSDDYERHETTPFYVTVGRV